VANTATVIESVHMPRDYTGLVLLALITSVGCLPDFHPLEGAACDALKPCPGELRCLANLCLSAATPDAVLLTSDFEAGLGGWEGTPGSRVTAGPLSPRGGLQALRASGSDGSTSGFGGQTTTTTLAVGSGRYCASGFALHGQGNGVLTMQLRAFGGAGGTALLTESSAAAPGATARLPATGKIYQPLRVELEIDAAVVSSVRLVVTSSSPAPADFFIDDLTVIRTVNACPAAN
jgi:hypothetical protein